MDNTSNFLCTVLEFKNDYSLIQIQRQMETFHNNTWYLSRESILHRDGTTITSTMYLVSMCVAPVVSPSFMITTPDTHTILIILQVYPYLPISCFGGMLLTCLTITQTLLSFSSCLYSQGPYQSNNQTGVIRFSG